VSSRPVLFLRADASQQMGSGHVMRCLALAEAAQMVGLVVHWLCRCLPGHLINELRERGQSVHVLDWPGAGESWQPADCEADAVASAAAMDALMSADSADHPYWVLVDHYRLDAAWHRRVSRPELFVAVLDDLADRPMDCALLIDQNSLESCHARYPALTPPGCVHLLGPDYSLLRADIRAAAARRAATVPTTTLVFLGGSDTGRLTEVVLDRLDALTGGPLAPPPLHVLCGAMNPHWPAVQSRCVNSGHAFSLAQRDLSDLLACARLAVVACGMFAVELQALEVPSLLVPLSDIQNAVADDFVRRGRAVVLPTESLYQPSAFDAAWGGARALPHEVSGRGFLALDGAQRVITQLMEMSWRRPH
jgi:UDP-2,4-diacetamido-2,4,6-trideoxy-beta-L-altropyranose hydrolase